MERRGERVEEFISVYLEGRGDTKRREERRGQGEHVEVYYGKVVVTLFAVNDADDQRETTAMPRIS